MLKLQLLSLVMDSWYPSIVQLGLLPAFIDKAVWLSRLMLKCTQFSSCCGDIYVTCQCQIVEINEDFCVGSAVPVFHFYFTFFTGLQTRRN